MQRGGSPTCKDRVYASVMGSMAVDLLLQGKTNRVVGYKEGRFTDFDIEEALAMKKRFLITSMRLQRYLLFNNRQTITAPVCGQRFLPVYRRL